MGLRLKGCKHSNNICIYQILAASNMLKIMSEVVLLLLNTNHLHHVEDKVRGCTRQFKKSNTIYRLHKLIFNRGYNSLECFKQENHYNSL